MAKKVRNKFLFKRGGYAVMAIALVIAAAVLLNVLVSIFADRMDLEFDLTPDKKNSLSAENEKFIKDIDKEVTVYVLAASEEDYYGSGYLQYYYGNVYYVQATNDEYYVQTTKLLNRYADLNDNIELVYVDPNGTQIGDILAKYSNEGFMFGDVIVSCEFTASTGKEISNYRHLSMNDIYSIYDPTEGMASMGMAYYDVNGSNLETSMTSALLSVTSEDTKKVAFINEKSKSSEFEYFRGVLELNNFIVEDVDVKVPISADYDVAVICAPSSDFTAAELDVLSVFLANDGKLGKTLLFYGDVQNQNTPNLYNFLADWGILAENGMVVETTPGLYTSNKPTEFLSGGVSGAPFTVGKAFLSGYNVPMRESKDGLNGRTPTTFIGTVGAAAVVPVNAFLPDIDPSELETGSYSTAIISTEEDYDNATQQSIFSHVIAFSSYDFISKSFIEMYRSNFDYIGVNLNALKYATNMNEVNIQIEPKVIEGTAERYVVSEQAVENMKIVFVYVIPACIIVLAFVIFFRRRNK